MHDRDEFLRIVSHPDFRLIGFSFQDIIEMKRFMDTHMLSIEDLRDAGVKKHQVQLDRIHDAVLEDSAV